MQREQMFTLHVQSLKTEVSIKCPKPFSISSKGETTSVIVELTQLKTS